MSKDKAVVLLSGGQDSTTCLLWAMKNNEVVALSFDYNQRHKKELEAAKNIARILQVKHKIIPLPINQVTESALTNHKEKIKMGKEYPNTFTAGRNIIFLAFAGSFAYSIGARDIVIGASQTDYSGYPDCRESFILAMEEALITGLGKPLCIHAPLINKTKAETVQLMSELGGLYLLDKTWTCYYGGKKPCGKCPACILRNKGIEEWKSTLQA